MKPNRRNGDTAFLPWKAPGATRRDCLPHRAQLLILLARLGWWIYVVSCFLAFLPGVTLLLILFFLSALDSGPATTIGVPVGTPVARVWVLLAGCCFVYWLGPAVSVVACRLARRDLRQMSAGDMDRAGEDGARLAIRLAKGTLTFAILLFVVPPVVIATTAWLNTFSD